MSEPAAKDKAFFFSTPVRKLWQKVLGARRAGILVPLFSVYSRRSTGIGDLGDIALLADWAKVAGNSVVQLLPMNEVGGVFCPYDALSSFAIDPMYISLELLGKDAKQALGGRIDELREALPCGRAHVDYQIKAEKTALLYEVFLDGRLWDSSELEQFRKDQEYWIEDFALYKALKNYFSGKAWYEWPHVYKYRDRGALEEFASAHRRALMFQVWLQWLCYTQFKEAKGDANAKGILLKGDLPILVSRDSADVWAHTEFFKLEYAAGAPPDMYCAKGQRWGMPTYNWQNIAIDNYFYMKEKFSYANNFYDILRIDHVVGLFRIWSISYGDAEENQGLNGFFDPPEEKSWGEHGKKILLMMIAHSKMLLCAEDLGVIPRVCPDTLRELRIPGNDVQRWVKDWNVRHDFLGPKDYRFLSVAMLSTHDTTNWLGWWENEAGTVDEALFIRKCAGRIDYQEVKDKLFDPARSRHGRLRWLDAVSSEDTLAFILGKPKQEIGDFIDLYLNTFQEKEKLWKQMGLEGPMREKGDAQILECALKITYDSNSIFVIQLMNDLLGLAGVVPGDAYDQRINTPGTVSLNNWSMVVPLPLEDLIAHPLNAKIKQLITSSGRI